MAQPANPPVPSVPDPVAVKLDRGTTALLVMDMTDVTCGPQPNCLAALPRVAALASKARAAGVPVLYTTGSGGGTPLPEVAPAEGDPIVQAAQNKFLSSFLDDHLRVRGIKTMVLCGWRANGSILFTSHGATVLRYTVVIPVDTTAAAQPADYAIGMYMVLSLISGNPNNEPLRQGAVTLSRSDLVEFA